MKTKLKTLIVKDQLITQAIKSENLTRQDKLKALETQARILREANIIVADLVLEKELRDYQRISNR